MYRRMTPTLDAARRLPGTSSLGMGVLLVVLGGMVVVSANAGTARGQPQPGEDLKAAGNSVASGGAAFEGVEVVVTLKDGRVFTGMLASRGEGEIVLKIAGIPATFKTSVVEQVRELAPVLERYKQMRDATPVDEVERRGELITWLVDRQYMDVALMEAEVLVSRNPRSGAAKKLLEDLQLKNQLLRPTTKSKPGADEPVSPEAPEVSAEPSLSPGLVPDAVATPIPESIPVADFPVLSAKQINLVKVYELDLSAEPNIIIPRTVVQQLLDTYASSPLVPSTREGREAILRQSPLRTMDLIYRLKARDFYERVNVVDHPAPLRRFRDDVNRSIILNSCATNQCHGGTEAGRLVFATFRPNADPTLYTNFYILQKFRNAEGEGLLNFENPERSLLVQMGLPRDIARVKHPPVLREGRDVWKPSFSGPDDHRHQATVEWIRSLYSPRPSYDLQYVPYRPFERPPRPVFENVER